MGEWQGEGANQREKANSMKFADQYIKEQNLPNTVTVTVIAEEQAKVNALFQGLFRGK